MNLEKINPIENTLITLEEVEHRASIVFIMFSLIVNELKDKYKNVTFQHSRRDPNEKYPYVSIFIIGNKKAASQYEMNEWKDTPVLSIYYPIMEQQVSDNKENKCYRFSVVLNYRTNTHTVDLTNINVGRLWSLSGNKMKEHLLDAIKNAIELFTEQDNNTLTI